jgi:hypothetical protein
MTTMAGRGCQIPKTPTRENIGFLDITRPVNLLAAWCRVYHPD